MNITRPGDDGRARPIPFRVLFRCDASMQMGTGHVMRCIALADGLRAIGGISHFICREFEGNLIERIRTRGFSVSVLPDAKRNPESTRYESSMDRFEAADAEDCRSIIKNSKPERVIIDHYVLGNKWAEIAVPAGCDILVIDDLANREFSCDLLLNQNLGAEEAAYQGLVPSATELLLGPGYAMLRPEFFLAREKSLKQRRSRPLGHVLVAFGGTDPVNATGKTLQLLSKSGAPCISYLTVILDGHAPFLEEVTEMAVSMPIPTRVLSGVRRMEEVLMECDVAIGAAGGSVWERCTLGVPSLLLTFADNQRSGMMAIERANAGYALGDLNSETWESKLLDALSQLRDAALLQRLSANASDVCDGQGTSRVVNAIYERRLTLRTATVQDAKSVWEWRNGGDASRFYRFTTPTPLPQHLSWFEKALANPLIHLLVVEAGSHPTGHIRFDVESGSSAAEISISLDAARRGQGFGARALFKAVEYARKQHWKRITAEIHRANAASIKAFKKAGFAATGDRDQFLQFALEL